MSATTCEDCGERKAEFEAKYNQDHVEFVDEGAPASAASSVCGSTCTF